MKARGEGEQDSVSSGIVIMFNPHTHTHPHTDRVSTLESYFYGVANEMVDNRILDYPYYFDKDEYVFLADDIEDFRVQWEDFLKSYIGYTEHVFIGPVSDILLPLHIIWKTKPEIVRGDSGYKYTLYARFKLVRHNTYWYRERDLKSIKVAE